MICPRRTPPRSAAMQRSSPMAATVVARWRRFPTSTSCCSTTGRRLVRSPPPPSGCCRISSTPALTWARACGPWTKPAAWPRPTRRSSARSWSAGHWLEIPIWSHGSKRGSGDSSSGGSRGMPGPSSRHVARKRASMARPSRCSSQTSRGRRAASATFNWCDGWAVCSGASRRLTISRSWVACLGQMPTRFATRPNF